MCARSSKLGFVVSPYSSSLEEPPKAVKPKRCPIGFNESSSCRVVVKCYRVRKTIPVCNLLVAECKEHGICYTVYPPGYTPYSRGKWVPVTEDGSIVTEEEVSASEESSAFETTLFLSALDGASGKKWPLSLSRQEVRSKEVPAGVFQTQKRHIKLFTKLFCIEPYVDIVRSEESERCA